MTNQVPNRDLTFNQLGGTRNDCKQYVVPTCLRGGLYLDNDRDYVLNISVSEELTVVDDAAS